MSGTAHDESEASNILIDIKNQIRTLSRRSTFRAIIPLLLLLFAGVQLFVWLGEDPNTIPDKPHVALVKIEGAIGPGSKYGDALKLVDALDKASKNDNVKAILIEANSGGGSPVHAEIVSNAINDIRKSGKMFCSLLVSFALVLAFILEARQVKFMYTETL